MPTLTTSTVSELLLQPLTELLPACAHTRHCQVLPDAHWLRFCLGRTLHDTPSGRAFIQEYGSRFETAPDVSTFFESLKSSRRLRLLQELNGALQPRLSQSQTDLLAAHSALNNFDVYAGDGHFHAAAAHDPFQGGTKYATGHFYGLNLRTQGMIHLTVGDQQARKKEHDMRALKRLGGSFLRQGAPKGRQVIWVWDPAGIDFRQWHDWKCSAGIYFISRTKENMALETIAEQRWNPSDPVNQGVLADDLVATSQGVAVRRVTYVDPEDGEQIQLLTMEMTLPPGLIVHLYRLRWNVEKVFDGFKNKLREKKAWASSPVAKSIQAQWLCLGHNLLLICERVLETQAAVRHEAEDRRRAQRLAERKTAVAQKGQTLPPLVETLQRCTQISVKFIRWVRAHFFAPTSCSQALPHLRALYAKL